MPLSSTGLWVAAPCSDVAGYQRFGGPRCLQLGVIFWAVTSYSDVVGYQRFWESCSFHLQESSKILVPCHINARRRSPQDGDLDESMLVKVSSLRDSVQAGSDAYSGP